MLAESREGDSATLWTVTRPPALSWCVHGTQWGLALARPQLARVLPCLLSSIPPDPRPALCLLRPLGLRRRHVLAGYSTRPLTPCFEHHPPGARHGARCLLASVRSVAALIRPKAQLYPPPVCGDTVLPLRRFMCPSLLDPLSSAPSSLCWWQEAQVVARASTTT